MKKGPVLVGSVVALLASIMSQPLAFAGSSTTSSQGNSHLNLDKLYTPKELGENVTAPPASFNPITASNVELKKYGFPERPTDPSRLQSWEDAMKHYKSFVVPKIKLKKPHSNVQRVQNSTSYNWSGFVATNNTYKSVEGTWWVPDVYDLSQPQGSAYSSVWVGIGGWYGNTNGLIQAGTQQENTLNDSSHSDTTNYNVWWEVWPYNYEQDITNLSVSPNDKIYTNVSYSGGTFSWYIENITTGAATSGSKSGISGYYDGRTAEWIVERPNINGSTPMLAHFSSSTYSGLHFNNDDAETSGGSWYFINSFSNENVEMVGSGRLAQPGSLGSYHGDFTDYWYNWD